MAKFYQRQSKGGRFDRNSVGDLGLRAFKDQQDQIIDSLKLQRLRSYEINKDNIREIESSKLKEQKWKEELQQLETKIHNNKVQNITKRGKDEADILNTKAAEYRKQAEFWQDFAPKFSKGLSSLASSVASYAGEKAAKAEFEDWKEDGGIDEYLKGQETAATIQANLEAENIEKTETQDESDYVIKTGRFARARTEEKIAGEIIANTNGIHDHLVRQLDNNQDVDHENLSQEYESLLDQLIKKEGIGLRSSAAEKIRNAFTKLRVSEVNGRHKSHNARENTKSIDDQVRSVQNISKNFATSSDYKDAEFNALNKMVGKLSVFDSKGKVVDPKDTSLQILGKNGKYRINPQQAGLHSYLKLIDQIESAGEYLTFEDWKAAHNYKTTEGEYYFKKHEKTYDPILSEAFVERINDLKKSEQEKEQAEQESAKVNVVETLDGMDKTDPADRQEVISMTKDYPQGHPARTEISAWVGFDPKHHNSIQLVSNLNLAILDGDLNEAMHYYKSLTKEGQKAYANKIESLNELQQYGITFDSINKESKGYIESISKAGKLSSATSDPTDKKAIEGRTLAWFHYNHQLMEDIPNVDQRVKEIETRLEKDLNFNNGEGRGWARRSTPEETGSNVQWLNYTVETDKNTLMSTTYLKDAVDGNSLKDVFDMTQSGSVVAQDDLDIVNDIVLRGFGEFPKSENVDYLAKRYGVSRRDVWNQILTHKYGKDAMLIPPDAEELAIHEIEQSPIVLPNSTKHYSPENLIRLNILTKLTEYNAHVRGMQKKGNLPDPIGTIPEHQNSFNIFMKNEFRTPMDWSVAPTSTMIRDGYKYVDKDGEYPIYNPLAGTTYFAEAYGN